MNSCVLDKGSAGGLWPSLAVAAALMLRGGRRARRRCRQAVDHDQGSKIRSRRTACAAGQAIEIQVKNLNPIVSEFESADLHFEKIVPAGGQASVFVRPLQPGRYNFYDDFHHATQGYLVVP